MSTRSKRMKATSTEVPTNKAEAEELLQAIGDMMRQVTVLETKMNDRLAAVKLEFERQAKPINEAIDQRFDALRIWAEANKSDLLKGKAKTAKLATGEISWRTTPPSVRITGVKVVIERLRQMGLTKFLRMKEDINKEAILADPAAVEGVKGISITQREELVVKPFEAEIERVIPIKKAA